MSLLRSGPHSVLVIPNWVVVDELGSELSGDEPPSQVDGVMIQPVSSADSDLALGTVGADVYRVIGAGTWPGGPYSTVFIQDGPPNMVGREFDQDGPARIHGASPRTAHFTVTIKGRRGVSL